MINCISEITLSCNTLKSTNNKKKSDYDYYIQSWISTNRKDCYPYLKGMLYSLPMYRFNQTYSTIGNWSRCYVWNHGQLNVGTIRPSEWNIGHRKGIILIKWFIIMSVISYFYKTLFLLFVFPMYVLKNRSQKTAQGLHLSGSKYRIP